MGLHLKMSAACEQPKKYPLVKPLLCLLVAIFALIQSMSAIADSVDEETVTPIAVVFLMDRSYSTKGMQIELAKKAAVRVLRSLGSEDLFSVMAFDKQPYIPVPLQKIESRRKAEALISLIQASGQTDIYPALGVAYRLLKDVEAERKIVILVSDGDSETQNFAELIERMREKDIVVSTITLGDKGNPDLMKQIATLGGGRNYVPNPGHYYVRSTDSVEGSAAYEIKRTLVSLGRLGEVVQLERTRSAYLKLMAEDPASDDYEKYEIARSNSLKPCASREVAEWSECTGSHEDESGYTFHGEWKNGKADGYGHWTFPGKDDVFIGKFSYRDDVPWGEGTYYWSNGGSFYGGMLDWKPLGVGIITYVDGDQMPTRNDGEGWRFATRTEEDLTETERLEIAAEYADEMRWAQKQYDTDREEKPKENEVADLDRPSERARQTQEQKRLEEEKQRLEEERLAEEERLERERYAEDQRAAEEERLAEKKRLEQETAELERQWEIERQQQEQKRLKEERLAEEQRLERERFAEEQRIADEKRLQEFQRSQEAVKQKEFQDRYAASNREMCDASATHWTGWSDCVGRAVFPSGEVFEGEWAGGGPAYGSYFWPSGAEYFGEFDERHRNGYGFFTWPDEENSYTFVGISRDDEIKQGVALGYQGGDYFIGSFSDQKHEGSGSYVYGPKSGYFGDVSVGDYRDGQFVRGVHLHGKKSFYAGEFVGDLKSGKGTEFFENGDIYIGEYSQGSKTGRGIYYFAGSGKTLSGIFERNEFVRSEYVQDLSSDVCDPKIDRIRWNDCYVARARFDERGYRFTGRISGGKPSGWGRAEYDDGSIFDGPFAEGVPNGSGAISFLNGEMWVGSVNELPTGTGVYVRSNSSPEYKQQPAFLSVYNPFFKKYENVDDLRGRYAMCSSNVPVAEWTDCYGASRSAEGLEHQGTYVNGVATGEGRLFVDGDFYSGAIRDGFPGGYGVGLFSDGSAWAGFWNGLPDGPGYLVRSDKSRSIAYFDPDKKKFFAYVTPAVDGPKVADRGEKDQADPREPKVKNNDVDPSSDDIQQASSGSGFFVSESGYAITNHHVIEGCQRVTLHNAGAQIPAIVVSEDPINDLALLKAEYAPPIVFSLRRRGAELLEDIYVAGFPFGYHVSTTVKVTKGIVSSLTGIANNISNVQIDASLQKGNSGGPIFDLNGNVIAVAVAKLDAKYSLDNFGDLPENINFGIKSSVVRNLLDAFSVDSPTENEGAVSRADLVKKINSGTYYVSCWMSTAQIEKMRQKKAFFDEIK